MTTRIVHCLKEPHHQMIDRRTQWGNPYLIGRDGTREEVIAKFEADLPNHPGLVEEARQKLKDLILA